jgi:hypothetical protein
VSSERILPQVRADLAGHRVRRFLDEEMACIQLDGPVRAGHVPGVDLDAHLVKRPFSADSMLTS